jgi:hypothetical protein
VTASSRRHTADLQSPEVLQQRRLAAEEQGWTIRPGTCAGVFVAARGDCKTFGAGLHELLLDLEQSSLRTKALVPLPQTEADDHADTPRVAANGVRRGAAREARHAG